MTPRSSWDRQQSRHARMTPEELTAWKAKRAARDRERHARKTPAGQARMNAELEEFLAGGAPTGGYSAFLRSREAVVAAQFNQPTFDERKAA